MESLVAYCGIDCSTCNLYIATITKSDELKQAVADEWNSRYGLTLVLSDMECLGCRSEQVCKCCQRCDIKACNIERNIEICTDCTQERCDRISQFYEHQETFAPNMKLYKR